MFRRFFVEHPRSVGESYVEHMGKACGFGGRMMLSGLACIVHGIVPRLFMMTGSSTVTKLYDQMILNRRKSAPSSSSRDLTS